MAETLIDLNGWEIIKTDDKGNLIDESQMFRRSRRRAREEAGGREHVYLQREKDGLRIGCGDSVVMHESISKTFSIYMIHEIRLNTLNHIVELWAFSYLRWFEVNPSEYYSQYEPQVLRGNQPTEFYAEKFSNETNKHEIYLTPELSEIYLKNFLDKATILDDQEFSNSSLTSGTEKNVFLVTRACEPQGANFASIDIHSFSSMVSNSAPKVSETYLKRITADSVVQCRKSRSGHRKSPSARVKESTDSPSPCKMKKESETFKDCMGEIANSLPSKTRNSRSRAMRQSVVSMANGEESMANVKEENGKNSPKSRNLSTGSGTYGNTEALADGKKEEATLSAHTSRSKSGEKSNRTKSSDRDEEQNSVASGPGKNEHLDKNVGDSVESTSRKDIEDRESDNDDGDGKMKRTLKRE